MDPFRIHVTHPSCSADKKSDPSSIITRISHAYLTVVFATSDHIPDLLKIAPKVPMVKMIVCIDDLSPDTKRVLTAWGEALNIQVKELRERQSIDSGLLIIKLIVNFPPIVEAIGKANPIEPIPVTPDQIVSICYTSVSIYSDS
jgi:long-chain acyl-CoA synthetase